MRVTNRPRRHIAAIAILAVAALIGAGAALRGSPVPEPETPPYALGVEVRPDGSRGVIPPNADVEYLPGSRVLDPGPSAEAATREAAEAQAQLARDWISEGRIPGEGTPYEDMVRGALLDIHALTDSQGAAVAGYNTIWRYVWPRDASFIAAALASAGQLDDAMNIMGFLQRVQHPDGSFEARYLPDESGPPDGRGIQTDGTGWVLWATDHILNTLEPTDPRRDEIREELNPMIVRSTTHLVDIIDPITGLPPASSDYWERRETRLTLGTAAPVLAGLRAAQNLGVEEVGQETIVAAANNVQGATQRTFSPRGYGRYANSTQRDAATAFLLPPFQPSALEGAQAAWLDSIPGMQRPGGGLAPGESWHEPVLSWTPQTSLYAMTAAHNGDPEMSMQWLDWIDAHRTSLGAIPEKVSSQGEPSAVAPLPWSGSLVILAVAQLEANGDI